MSLDETLLARNGVKNLGDAVADVVADDIAHEESCQEDAHDGIHQIGPVGTGDGEMVGQQMLHLLDEPLQEQAG